MEDLILKKRVFGGFDPDSVIDYITSLKAENEKLKKELAERSAEKSKDDNFQAIINELNNEIIRHKNEKTELKKEIDLLKEKCEKAEQSSCAENSKIAVESLNLANRYIRSAVKLSSEVTDSTAEKAEKSKEVLGESLGTIDEFEDTMVLLRKRIDDMMRSFDDISDTFGSLKKYEDLSVEPPIKSDGVELSLAE